MALSNGCIAHYKLNDLTVGAGKAIDWVGAANGTHVNMTVGANIVAGKINSGITFNGIDEVITADAIMPDLIPTTTGTWIAWIYTAVSNHSGVILASGQTNAARLIRIELENGQLRARCFILGLKWDLATDADIPTSEWVHVAIVQDGVRPVLYVNSVAVAQTLTSEVDTTTWFTSPSMDNFRMGCLNADSAGNLVFFNGKLDAISIWNRALTLDEIRILYNNGYGTEDISEIDDTFTARRPVLGNDSRKRYVAA